MRRTRNFRISQQTLPTPNTAKDDAPTAVCHRRLDGRKFLAVVGADVVPMAVCTAALGWPTVIPPSAPPPWSVEFQRGSTARASPSDHPRYTTVVHRRTDAVVPPSVTYHDPPVGGVGYHLPTTDGIHALAYRRHATVGSRYISHRQATLSKPSSERMYKGAVILISVCLKHIKSVEPWSTQEKSFKPFR